jgi:deoxyribose-phosphate aldolase
MMIKHTRKLAPKQLAAYIQFTRISPDLTKSGLVNHIELCKQYQFNAAMIAPCWVPLVKEMLKNTGIKTSTFIDFGMGNNNIGGKIALIRELRKLGAEEVDYAPNMGYFLSGMYEEFFIESKEIVDAAEMMPVKAMLQLGMIKEETEKKHAIRLLDNAGVNWIKNSSGGWPPGSTNATVDDIRLIKETITGKSRVKASGGIRNYKTAVALIEAGAELLGTSYGPEIIQGIEENDLNNLNQGY